ncbi:hypothetical protein FRX31_021657 [Thalictrum thalictroides]|uniref:Uncharacterized protein n=1 Tax=Thalictrum thalictroides TaxID=46969 RepID=A0A7J6VUH6_THATH|nr:hypothetical protein FRX31_021657 [Thalictrum thalictroides]
MEYTKSLLQTFQKWEIQHTPRQSNRHADSLAYLASQIDTDKPRMVYVDVSTTPAYNTEIHHNEISDFIEIPQYDIDNSWMGPIINYLLGVYPDDDVDLRKLDRKSKSYELINN